MGELPGRSPVDDGRDFAGQPFGLSWRAHHLFIVSTVTVGLFDEAFIYGLVVPVLPFILQDCIGISHDDLQRYSSTLLAAFGWASLACAAFAGTIADRTRSRKAPFMFGLAISIAGTILFFTGRSIPLLMIARCAQGAGAAFIWIVGFALCLDTVGIEDIGKTLGTVMSIVQVAELASPPLGAIIYSQGGIFAVAAAGTGILVLDIPMRMLLIEKKIAARYVGNLLTDDTSSDINSIRDSSHFQSLEDASATGRCPLLGSEETLREYSLPLPRNRVLQTAPLLLCLRNSSLVEAIFGSIVQAALLGAFEATISLQAKDLFNFDSLHTGLFFVPLACLRLLMGPIGGWAVDRYGPRPSAVLGNSFLMVVLVLFRLVEAEPRSTQIAFYSTLLALSGIGMATVGTAGFVAASAVVGKYHQRNPGLFGQNGPFASLCGISFMAFSVGIACGTLLGGGLRDRIGYGNMNAVLGGLAGLSALTSFIWKEGNLLHGAAQQKL